MYRCPKCGEFLEITDLHYIGGHGYCRKLICTSDRCDYFRFAGWKEAHNALAAENDAMMASDYKEDQAMYRNLAHGF
jgi:hypothetical protein